MKYFFEIKVNKKIKGFTLVELLVVISLFTTVMMVALGALFSAQAVNTKLQQTQVILDGVNLAMEEMVRDMRYGTVIYCTSSLPQFVPDRQSCPYPNGNTVLIFKPASALTSNNSTNDRVAYFLSNGSIYRQSFPEGVASNPVQITTTDVSIESIKFYVKGAESTTSGTPDYLQPVITFSIFGITKPTQPHIDPVRFSTQTTVSSRKLDN